VQQVVDFHIHSPYSRGVSKKLTLKLLAIGAAKKGLTLIGTGDVLYPKWNRHLQELLVEESDGIYKLKEEENVYFIGAGEVEDNEHIHHLIIVPDLKTGYDLADELERKSKISLSKYGGRPRVDLDGSKLVKIVKEYSGMIGPAHSFTPFTAIFRENRYSSLEECYKDYSSEVDFIELGLSANSSLADRIKELWNFPFLSNSDSHSQKATKLGREANILEIKTLSYQGIRDAIKGKKGKIVKNIGIDPRLGKYYSSFCYKCRRRILYARNKKQSFDDDFIYVEEDRIAYVEDLSKKKKRCPACNGILKLGVRDRIELLATTKEKNVRRPDYLNIIPLTEVISKNLKIKNPEAKTVLKEYNRLLRVFGSEIDIIVNIAISEIKAENEFVGEIVEKMRKNSLDIIPGGGGHYGSLA